MTPLSEVAARPPGRPELGYREPGPVGQRENVPLIMQYIRIVSRRRWLVLGAIGLALIAGIVVTLLTTPQYTATSTIEISRESAKVVNVQGVEPERQGLDLEFYQTQYGLLASRSLAERVANSLRLIDDPEFFERYGDKRERYFPEAGSNENAAALREKRRRRAIDLLLHYVGIAPSRGSSLVNINFTSPSPAFSAQVSNSWVDNFLRQNLERRFEATSYARKFLENRLEQVRERLEASERALVSYAGEQKIINVPVSAEGGGALERPLIASDLSGLSTALTAATAARAEAEARWRTTQGGDAGAIPESLTNVTVASLRRDLAQAQGEYQQILQQYEPQYPGAQAVARKIAGLQQAIAQNQGLVRSSIYRGYQDAVARENMLRGAVNGAKNQLLDTRRRSIQYNIFQREVDTNRELYNGLLQRYKEVGVAGGVGVNNLSIVDRAAVPQKPSQPNMLRNLLIALLAGTVLGFMLAIAREQIDDGIADPSDVERTLGLPLVGVVPKERDADIVEALFNPRSSAREAYIAIQTNLAFSTDHGVPRSIAVTSTGPAEGKSTSAYALALMLTRSGKRVVLIDGDMRSPSVHHLASIPNKVGLSNFLAGDDNVDGMIATLKGDLSLALLPAGPQPPNAAELLTGNRFRTLIDRMLTKFDHVVVDSPPVMGLADAPLIASSTEGAVFAVEANSRGLRVVRRALARLGDSRAHLLGVIVTKFDVASLGFGYGHDYGYGYGYGYGQVADEDRPAK